MSVKLRKPVEIPRANGATSHSGEPIPIKPLEISAVCISRGALLEALRIYLPTISDIQVLDAEDGERFLLTIGPAIPSDPSDPPV
jgi:hypothetical protein